MALLDVVSKFRIKPLDLTEADRLIPRDSLPPEKASTDNIAMPSLSNLQPVSTSTTPTTKTVLAPAPAQTIQLAEKHAGLQPFANSLYSSEIKGDDARYALLSQVGLETGWKAPADNNYGNIIRGRSWKGASQIRGDHDAKGNPIKQDFRSYASIDDFTKDYMALLKKNYPTAYAELTSGNFDIDRFTSGLVDGKLKYAEDPEYKNKLKRIYQGMRPQQK